MIGLRRICAYSSLWLALLPGAGLAQDTSVEDLTGLSLEDLTRTRLITASRHLDDPRKAPAVVTVIEGDEIRRYGWRTLAELLRSVTGFYTAYDRTYTYAGTRGFLQSGDYNARILLLIDGHRINENVYDSAMIGTEFFLDLNLIDRVEIVRGPGSSLYGTNAELAVVNVFTRRPDKRLGLEATSDYQTYLGRTGELTASFRLHELDGIVSGSLYRSNGQSPMYFPEFDSPDTNNGLADNLDGDRFDHAFASLRRGSLHIEGLFGVRRKLVPNASYGDIFNDPDNFSIDKRGFVEATYNRSSASHIDFDLRVYYDAYRFYASYATTADDNTGRAVEINSAVADWTGIEAVVGRRFGQQRIVAGASGEYNLRINQKSYYIGQPYFLNDNRSPWLAAVFGEAELNPSKWLCLSLGGRIDYYSTDGAAASPRVAMMYLPTANTSLKYVFSRAFRAPDPYDQYDVDIGFFGNATLQPEDIYSHTVILDHRFGKWGSVSLNGFADTLNKTIEEHVDPSSGSTVFVNQQGDRGRGLEFEALAKSASGWSGRASYSYVQTRQKLDGRPAMNSPKNLAKFNGSAPILNFADLGVELLYNGSQMNYAGQRISPSFLANATLATRALRSGWEFSVSCYNLFDRKWATPTGPEIAAPATVQDGRTYRVHVAYRWSLKSTWKTK
ncbi:MAG: TonB-dependent receptor [Terracidiphilus sp.]|jgi:iron complex outermembrane receptor protein